MQVIEVIIISYLSLLYVPLCRQKLRDQEVADILVVPVGKVTCDAGQEGYVESSPVVVSKMRLRQPEITYS